MTATSAGAFPTFTVVVQGGLTPAGQSTVLKVGLPGFVSTTETALSPKKSVVISNWVDVQKFAYRPHNLHRPVTVGLIGQISPHKGHNDAIEAMRSLGREFRLLIAGKGNASYEAILKRKAAGLAVEFFGFASLPDFFDRTDILIMPSWEEPFGIVLQEAMASERLQPTDPVV